MSLGRLPLGCRARSAAATIGKPGSGAQSSANVAKAVASREAKLPAWIYRFALIVAERVGLTGRLKL